MNTFAFYSTTFALKRLINYSKTRVRFHGEEKLPKGSVIYVINHFTRLETVLLPYYLKNLTKIPIWTLADAGLFKGALADFLDKSGALSTKNPDRDELMVRSLLTGEASWIIFPEGRMVKSKKIMDNDQFIISSDSGKYRPHTGAATLALRTEFYRERIRRLLTSSPGEAERLLTLFNIETVSSLFDHETVIVPVNITYYPMFPKENILTSLAESFVEDLTERMIEELMTEGTMIFSGVDIDINFGDPIHIRPYLDNSLIEQDIASLKEINFDDPIASAPLMKTSATEIMESYMGQIYGMTTINHDHLFASVLKLLPFKIIDEDDYLERVFLAIEFARSNGFILHESLREPQVQLLTDDRYKKYENFIGVAEMTGVVRREERAIIRDYDKFELEHDFHKIRVENPIAVIANEVEPLRRLQSAILRIAMEPPYQIKRRLTATLLERASREYEKAYKSFFIEGESKDISVGKPVMLEGKTRAVGVLLIHGYMAAPLEIRELALYLQETGFWVYGPRLAGHGTSPDDLATRKYIDWVESAEQGYLILKNMCDKVVVGGFSTGAGLALDLVSRVKDPACVFAVAPPMKLQDFSTRFVPAVDTWNQLMAKMRFNAAKKEYVINSPENPHINYLRNPISSLRELDRLMNDLEPKLEHITIPALVVQARLDPVVNPKGTRKIFDLIGSETKEYFIFSHNRHGILLGPDTKRVHRAIGDFISSVINETQSIS
jgi:esterase/lipase/1-acyl-sn-glycerol-3-phosphate acyltransferase